MDRGEILQRFENWLDSSLSNEDPPPGIPPEIFTGEAQPENSLLDWHSMWAAMTALTQEVKLQGRSFKQLSENLGADAERRGRKDALAGLLEMRERLSRGLATARARQHLHPTLWDRIFTKRWREIEHALSVVGAMEEGYRLTLGYLDDLLLQFQLTSIDCEGRPFDPRRMNAVDTEETDQVAAGTVLSVYRAGYEWNGELFRAAQVRVAKSKGNGVGK